MVEIFWLFGLLSPWRAQSTLALHIAPRHGAMIALHVGSPRCAPRCASAWSRDNIILRSIFMMHLSTCCWPTIPRPIVQWVSPVRFVGFNKHDNYRARNTFLFEAKGAVWRGLFSGRELTGDDRSHGGHRFECSPSEQRRDYTGNFGAAGSH